MTADCAAVPICYQPIMDREMLLALLLGYLLGSIPFGLLLTRLAGPVGRLGQRLMVRRYAAALRQP